MVSLQDLVANVDNVIFDTEEALEMQIGAQLLPFRGMDKSGMAVCVYFNGMTRTGCDKEQLCPFRHIVGDKTVVCKHWLRGLCKKGDDCEFLHEYDLEKMPECFFFSKYNACNNKECPFRHVDPESRIKDCPWYDRGFCRHGPHCKSRHRRRVLCQSYMCGFCIEGSQCKYAHPSFDLPSADLLNERRSGNPGAPAMLRQSIICHNCQQRGHKASQCPNPARTTTTTSTNQTAASMMLRPTASGIAPSRSRQLLTQQLHERHAQGRVPLTEITCYKCGEKGHFANRCTRSSVSFLTSHDNV